MTKFDALGSPKARTPWSPDRPGRTPHRGSPPGRVGRVHGRELWAAVLCELEHGGDELDEADGLKLRTRKGEMLNYIRM